MDQTTWMNHPLLADIPQEKLNFLQQLVFESEHLTAEQRMPFFLALASRSRQAHIQFTEDEISRIISILKLNSTPSEIAKMDQVLKMFRSR
ncbi:MAG: hypothetical protein RRX92_05995 [Lachnospiraceae bacterium]